MSTSIDNRIVGLQFDNKQFQKNVGKTLDSLDELHDKLNMKNVSKGFDELEKAASKCDMSKLEQAAEVIKSRFSLMGMVGMRVFNRIADTAINAASRIVKGFTIAPVFDGYKEYELKMSSIQTIVASTGEELGTVNAYLEELNRYSDKTIYSFADMTQNIGKFTNAGVDLDKAVTAIQGISNEAAVSGANAQEASRAMYNFSQALSAGYVKLIDWKSIENANMATREFKQELIDTAVALGTLKRTNDGMYKAGNMTISATQNFNDSLQKQWMTSEVLIQTLQRYSDENTEIGKKAFAAAQDIKTYSQMMDTLKESVGSGWAQISEIIIGDLDEAKKLWTSVGNIASSAIEKAFSGATNFLKQNLSSNYKQWLENGPVADATTFSKNLAAATEARNDPIHKQIAQNHEIILSYQMLQKEWLKYNEFQTAASQNKAFFDPDTGEQVWWMPKPKDFETTADEIAKLVKQNESLSASLEDTSYNATDVRNALLKTFDDIYDKQQKYDAAGYSKQEQLDALNLTEKQLAETLKWREGLRDGTIDVEELADSFNELSGRDKLVKGIGNSFKFLGRCLSPIKWAIHDVFAVGNNRDWLRNFADKFYKFSLGLDIDSARLEEVKARLTGLLNGLKATGKTIEFIFTPVKKLASKVAPTVKKLSSALWDGVGALSNFGNSFLAYVDSGSLAADATRMWTAMVDAFNNALKKLQDKLKSIPRLKPALEFFERFNSAMHEAFETGDFGSVFSALQGGFKVLGESLKEMAESIEKLNSADRKSIFDKIKTSLISFTNVIEDRLGIARGKISEFLAFVKEKFNTELPSIIGASFLTVYGIGLMQLVTGVSKISKTFYGLAKAVSAIKGKVVKVLGAVSNYLNSMAAIKKATAFTVAAHGLLEIAASVVVLVGAMWLITKIPEGKLVESMAVVLSIVTTLSAIAVATSKLGGKAGAMSISAVAVSILVMAYAVKVLSALDVKWAADQLWYMLEVIAALGAITVAASALGKTSDNFVKQSLSLVAMTVAMIAVIKMIEVLATAHIPNIKTTVVNLGIALAAIVSLMAVSKLAGKHAFKGGLALAAIAFALNILIPMVYLLARIEKPVLRKATVTVASLSVIFAILFASTKTAGEYAHKAAAAILAIGLAMVPLLGVIYMLGHMDTRACVQGVLALDAVFVGLALVVRQINTISIDWKSTLGLISLVLTVGMIVGALSLINASNVKAAGISLASVLLGISAMVFAISKFKVDWKDVGKFAVLAAIVAGISLVIGLLGKLPNPNGAAVLAIALGDLLLRMTVALAALTVIGKFTTAPTLFAGLIGLVAVIGVFGTILAALGSIADGHENAEKFINEGIPMLTAIGTGIGQLIGGVIGGISGGTLIGFGDALSQFATALTPFIDAMSKVPDGIGQNVKGLATAILSMTAADLITAISGLLGISNIGAFDQTISAYADGLISFSEKIKSIPDDIVNKTKLAAEAGAALAEMAKNIPNDGGVWGWLVGNNNMGDFAKSFQGFGEALRLLSEEGANINKQGIKNVYDAGTDIAAMATEIPNMGGKLGDIVGENNMSDFKDQFDGFGSALSALSEAGVGINLDGIDNVYKSGLKISEMAEAIPNFGGKWAEFWGDNTLDDFGKQLPTFTWSLNRAAVHGESIKADSFASIRESNDDLIAIVNSVKGLDLSGLAPFSKKVDSYLEWITGISEGKAFSEGSLTAAISSAMETIVKTFQNHYDDFRSGGKNAMGKFISGMSWKRGAAIQKAASIANSVTSALNKYSDAHTSGTYVTAGFIAGMKSDSNGPFNTAYEIGKDAIKGLDAGTNSHSPSREARKSGGYVGTGFILGMLDTAKAISTTATSLGVASISAINDAIDSARIIADSDMIITPVIRPVVDTTDLDRGFHDIDTRYNGHQVTTVAAGRRRVVDSNNGDSETTSVNGDTYNFYQNNYSPKALRRIDIYRSTKNQFSQLRGLGTTHDKVNHRN